MRIITYIFALAILFNSCHNANSEGASEQNSEYREIQIGNDEYETYEEESDIVEEEGFEDGTYSATVEYYNPETDYSATYTLEVEVESNQVTVIYFPNNGYLDDDHIWPDELDENGFVSIEGEAGKTYDIQIHY